MALRSAGKPDPGVWLPLLDEYRITSLPSDTLLEGTLRPGLDAASTEVQEALRAWPAAAYLQSEGDRTRVALVYHTRDERGPGPWLHVALFVLTFVSTMAAGALMAGFDPFDTAVWTFGELQLPYPSALRLDLLLLGIPFAAPFMTVLLAHEMGHYVAARTHRVRATLPYFIPFPPYLSIIGTVGAFIRLKGPTVRRAILFDVGAAGPLAGFVLSVPILAVGMLLSEPVPGPLGRGTPFVIQFLGQPVWLGSSVMTHALATWLAPVHPGEMPILLHPLALVGWLGLFVTALNLLPLGQLDGGHILYALAPRHQAWAGRVFMAALIPLGLFWWGWWAWAAVVLIMHRGRVQHPTVVQPEPELDRVRVRLGLGLVVIFLLTFVPVPLNL